MVKFVIGSESTIFCPNCMPPRRLVVRENKQNGHQFLGCPNWPACDYTAPIPEEWKMRASGQIELFSAEADAE